MTISAKQLNFRELPFGRIYSFIFSSYSSLQTIEFEQDKICCRPLPSSACPVIVITLPMMHFFINSTLHRIMEMKGIIMCRIRKGLWGGVDWQSHVLSSTERVLLEITCMIYWQFLVVMQIAPQSFLAYCHERVHSGWIYSNIWGLTGVADLMHASQRYDCHHV